MSYHALYRKYRPATLKDVIGQDVVIHILNNAIINNKVCHAYMFSGPRGIGKTSIAKLLAKTVNCLEPKDGDACGKCKNCISISSEYNPDIIEIDAASNNGVDEIREIKNKINLVPTQLKYKVYIIDEVHMLSIGAFNALLKTLEEPPEHVIFILATTDLHKVPTTIISRCQCFEFHRIGKEDIIKRLKHICENEKIKVDDQTLMSIAMLADGGMRDAIGMLDKLNAYSNSNVTVEDFEKVNGIVSIQKQEELLSYVSSGDIVNTIRFIDNIYDNGKELSIFVNNIIELCKNKIVDYYINNVDCDIEFLLSFSKTLNNLTKNISFLSNAKTTMEISFLNYINEYRIEKNNTNDNHYQQDNKKDPEIISREIILDSETQKNDNDSSINSKKIINNCFASANRQLKKDFETKWSKLNEYALDNEFGAVACFLLDGKICAVGNQEVIISFDYESMINRGNDAMKKIELLLEKILNKHYFIALITSDDWNKEKAEYIKNVKNKIEYVYEPIILEPVVQSKKSIDKKTIASEAAELFGDDIIAIN